MATHSCVLAWRIPGTGEPGGLPSMGSQSRTRLKHLSSSSSSSSMVLNNSYITTLKLQTVSLKWAKFLKDVIKLLQIPSEGDLEQGL